MTDTQLILSGAKEVQTGLQRGREVVHEGVGWGGSAVLCGVLLCHSYIVPSSAPFSLCLLIFYYITLLAYIERKNLDDLGLHGKRSIYLQEVLL